jgi:hypothetical protein
MSRWRSRCRIKGTLPGSHLPPHLRCDSHECRSYFWSRFLEGDGILYVQYNRCWGRELEQKYSSTEKAGRLPSFTNFAARVLDDLKKPETSKFVLGLRFYPGGSSPQGTEFAREVGKI